MTEEPELSPIALARLASGLTIDDAATITGMARLEYEQLERRPLQLSVGELHVLCQELNSDGKAVLMDWFRTFFGL